MNLYETVKAAVPLREAVTRYGLRVNWSGMTRCLFHEDHTLSMKLNENYFYCFGCGTHGDVILVSDSNVIKHLNPANGVPFAAAHKMRGDTPCHISFGKSFGFACRSQAAADKTIGAIVLSRKSMIDLTAAIFQTPGGASGAAAKGGGCPWGRKRNCLTGSCQAGSTGRPSTKPGFARSSCKPTGSPSQTELFSRPTAG